MVAARDGMVEIAEKLLNAGADLNQGKDSITPLMAACYCGHLEMAKLLVGRGPEVTREGKTPDRVREKITALSIAANGKFSDLAKWLMDNGATVKDRNQIMLVDAARRGQALEIKKLLAKGAKTDQPDSLTKQLPLDVAAGGGHGEAVALLLEAGAQIGQMREIHVCFVESERVATPGHNSCPAVVFAGVVHDGKTGQDGLQIEPETTFGGFAAVMLAQSIHWRAVSRVPGRLLGKKTRGALASRQHCAPLTIGRVKDSERGLPI